MSNPSKIAVMNQKGGVGKTTVAINVAGALAARGREVVVVDLDPQGNATEALGLADAYDADPPSLFDVLTEPEQRDGVGDLLREHEEMAVLPSNIDMTAAEPELTLSRRGGEQLALALERLETSFDYIFVDCPPNLGNLTDNALFACQRVLIPALAETTSKRAFELLYDHIESLELDYEIEVTEVGVVINRIDVRKNQATEMIDWIESAFPETPVWRVRERAAIQQALEAHESLVASAPDSDMAARFETIAADIEAALEGEDE